MKKIEATLMVSDNVFNQISLQTSNNNVFFKSELYFKDYVDSKKVHNEKIMLMPTNYDEGACNSKLFEARMEIESLKKKLEDASSEISELKKLISDQGNSEINQDTVTKFSDAEASSPMSLAQRKKMAK